MADKKRIVVVGGGVAGTTVAHSFDTDAYNLTLVDPYAFLILCPCESILCPSQHYFAFLFFLEQQDVLTIHSIVGVTVLCSM